MTINFLVTSGHTCMQSCMHLWNLTCRVAKSNAKFNASPTQFKTAQFQHKLCDAIARECVGAEAQKLRLSVQCNAVCMDVEPAAHG